MYEEISTNVLWFMGGLIFTFWILYPIAKATGRPDLAQFHWRSFRTVALFSRSGPPCTGWVTLAYSLTNFRQMSPNDQRSRAVCWGFFHALAAGARTVRSMIFTPARTGRAARGFLQKKQEKPRVFKENPRPGRMQQSPGKSICSSRAINRCDGGGLLSLNASLKF